MPLSSTSQASSASVPTRGPELVTRPDPGLARGRWEAPAWAFWVALAVILLGAAIYVQRRLRRVRSESDPRV